MRQKLMLGALIVIVLLMAALEHVAGRHPLPEPSGIAREATDPAPPHQVEAGAAGVSASPLLTR